MMSPTFLSAAASYFGINPEQIAGSDWHNADGQMVVAFEFNVSEGDLVGIVDRMKTMLAQEPAVVEEVADESEHKAQARKVWDAMDAPLKGRFGSFGRFLASGGKLIEEPATAEAATIPAYVLVDRSQVTEYQKVCSPVDPATGCYMVQVDDLTPEQKKIAKL